jgi:hypothetical protein
MAASAAAYPLVTRRHRRVVVARARRVAVRALATLARSVAIFVPVFFVVTFVTFALRALTGLSPGAHAGRRERLADAGPHPNKAHAAWGRRAHRLEPDPATAPGGSPPAAVCRSR